MIYENSQKWPGSKVWVIKKWRRIGFKEKIHYFDPIALIFRQYILSISAGRRSKNLGGPVLKDLDQLDRLVNSHYIESGKIWGGHGPPGPLGSAGPVYLRGEDFLQVSRGLGKNCMYFINRQLFGFSTFLLLALYYVSTYIKVLVSIISTGLIFFHKK